MATKKQGPAGKAAGVSKVQLAMGAASLFLFIVGLKRTFRVEEGQGTRTPDERMLAEGGAREGASRAR